MGDIRADMPTAPATSRAAIATSAGHAGSGQRTADTDLDRTQPGVGTGAGCDRPPGPGAPSWSPQPEAAEPLARPVAGPGWARRAGGPPESRL